MTYIIDGLYIYPRYIEILRIGPTEIRCMDRKGFG
jgi:hypothetical protein